MNTQNDSQTPTTESSFPMTPATRLAEIERVYARRPQDALTLRRQAEELEANIADMTRTLLRVADRYGWDCPQVQAMDADITRWQTALADLCAQIRAHLTPPVAQQSA